MNLVRIHALNTAASLIEARRQALVTRGTPHTIDPHLDLVEFDALWQSERELRQMISESLR